MDSAPDSEIMSMDQISIQLSSGSASDRSNHSFDPQVEMAKNAATDRTDGVDEAENSVQEDSDFADCNLSEVNYRSSFSNNRNTIPELGLP